MSGTLVRMPHITLTYFRQSFYDILSRVEAGESFTITRYGKPVATLTPATRRNREDINATIDEILEMRKRLNIGDVDIRGLIEKGRM